MKNIKMAYKIKRKKTLTKEEKEILRIWRKLGGKIQTPIGRVPKKLTKKDLEKLQAYGEKH